MRSFTEIWRETARLNGFEQYADDERFTRLRDLLFEANARMNLTAIRDDAGCAVLHFADSLTAAYDIPQGANVIDVGCGGGFPCLPLAIARPDIRITALDSTAKKLGFVEYAARELGLDNLTTLCGRAEELGRDPTYRERFDCATARAVASLDALCEICLPFVRVGGDFVAMKSRDTYQTELESAAPIVRKLGGSLASRRELTLRFPYPDDRGDPERVLLTFAKRSATPASLPRKWAQIKKTQVVSCKS